VPELPDVEVFRRYLVSTSLHQRIKTVQVESSKILGNVSAKKLRIVLRGHELEFTVRYGKFLFVHLSSCRWLALHFGMTGYLRYFKDVDKKPAHDRMVIGFANGFHLGYYSQRLLGSVQLVDDPNRLIETKRLGPDALDRNFDLPAFERVLAARRGMVKSILMNQQIIAGIGNIYADEILFRAQIHPARKTVTLDKGVLRSLFRSMRTVLHKAVVCGADVARFPRTYLTPHRHPGGQCPRCGTNLERIKIANRGAYFCPHCQRLRRHA
jgi:formamidopyrimidine-DNA glycosylase